MTRLSVPRTELALVVVMLVAALYPVSVDAATSTSMDRTPSSFTNPTLPNENLPDPGVLRWNATTFLVANTGGDGAGGVFPIRASTDLADWTASRVGSIFPKGQLPSWANAARPWAPELHTAGFSDGNVRAYYVMQDSASGLMAIGGAVADTQGGSLPVDEWHFRDSGAPLVINMTGQGFGYIDPSHYYDAAADQHWLLFKRDGNAVLKPTPLYAAPLSADGLRVTGKATVLITNNITTWELWCIEAPWMVRDADSGTLFLFFSGPGYCYYCGYSVGVARSVSGSVLGPWEKLGEPILHSNGTNFESPGHCSVLPGLNGHMAIVYHAYVEGQQAAGRMLMLDELEYVTGGPETGTWPRLASGGTQPTKAPQPVP